MQKSEKMKKRKLPSDINTEEGRKRFLKGKKILGEDYFKNKTSEEIERDMIKNHKVLRKDLKLETCGQNGEWLKDKKGKKICFITDHRKGCYIRFRGKFGDRMVDYSEERHDVVVDRDKKGRIIGIEFWDGL